MDQHDEIVLTVASQVRHDCFPRLRQFVAAIAESALFKYLPAIGRNQFMIFVKRNEIDVIAGGFEKDKILSSVAVEVAGDDVIEPAVLNRCFVTIEFGEFPNVASEWERAYSVQAH